MADFQHLLRVSLFIKLKQSLQGRKVNSVEGYRLCHYPHALVFSMAFETRSLVINVTLTDKKEMDFTYSKGDTQVFGMVPLGFGGTVVIT